MRRAHSLGRDDAQRLAHDGLLALRIGLRGREREEGGLEAGVEVAEQALPDLGQRDAREEVVEECLRDGGQRGLAVARLPGASHGG
jgi:hypothetical protein